MSEIPFSQRLSCSVTEAMQVTGLSRTTINIEMKAGRIASTRVAGRRLIFVKSLLEFLQSGTERTEQEAVAA
jgi:predicted site-specific integrase-resolvase